jgi:hypothetical protein
MRKLILKLSLAIFFIADMDPQNSGWSINAGVGIAVPVGKFGNKDINDSTALSFARIGYASSGSAPVGAGTIIGTGIMNQTHRYPKQPFATINCCVGVGINL